MKRCFITHRCRAGGKIRSGPLVGQVATSPLPSRGSPPLQSEGQNQKWPICGQSGYVTPAISGFPTASEWGGGGDQKWPTCGQSGFVTPALSGIPTASEWGGESEVAHLWAKWLRHPCSLGDPHPCTAGGRIRSGPLVGKVATSPLPSRGFPPLQSEGENQKWPTCGQCGHVTPALSGIPTASKRGGNSEVAHLWAKWLRHPCPLGDPHRFRAGGKNQKWPTCGQKGYVTPAVSGIPTASKRGGNSEVAHLWAKWLRHPCPLGDPHRCRARGKIRSGPLVGKVATSPLPSRGSPPLRSGGGGGSEVAHLWAKWLRHPCPLGDPHRFGAGGKIRGGPLVGSVATSPLPPRGSPPLQSGGGKSEVAHLWAKWLSHPCHLGDPHRFTAGGKIRSGPLVGKVATSPLPSRGSPPLQSGGGKGSEVAHLWAVWLRHPCHLGDPHRFGVGGGGVRSGPLVGKVATSPLPSRGSPPLQSGGGKSEVAHLWAVWLRHPCPLGDPHRFRAGGKIRSGPLVGKVPTSPLPSRGSPPLRSGGRGDQKWPTCGQIGFVTPAVSGFPTALERGAKSEIAHLWAVWLRHPCRLGDPHRRTAGGRIRSGPLVGKVPTSPLPSRGSPPLQSGGEIRSGPLVGKVATPPLPSRGSPPLQSGGGGDQKWPTCGQSGHVTPAVSGIPTAAERGAKSEVAHLWAKWLRHPCHLGVPHLFRARGKIRSGPLVGKVAMPPLPSR